MYVHVWCPGQVVLSSFNLSWLWKSNFTGDNSVILSLHACTPSTCAVDLYMYIHTYVQVRTCILWSIVVHIFWQLKIRCLVIMRCLYACTVACLGKALHNRCNIRLCVYVYVHVCVCDNLLSLLTLLPTLNYFFCICLDIQVRCLTTWWLMVGWKRKRPESSSDRLSQQSSTATRNTSFTETWRYNNFIVVPVYLQTCWP